MERTNKISTCLNDAIYLRERDVFLSVRMYGIVSWGPIFLGLNVVVVKHSSMMIMFSFEQL